MTVSTSLIHDIDAKHLLWRTLRDEFASLAVAYPNKIDVKVIKVYPTTTQDIDKTAIVTVSRITAPEEIRFFGDLVGTELDTSQTNFLRNKGALYTDYYEIGIWSLNSDYRDQLYYIVNQIMFEKRRYILGQGYLKFTRVTGGDEEVDTGQMPRVIYRAKHIYQITGLVQTSSVEDLVSSLDITQTVLVDLTKTSWSAPAQDNKVVP